MTTQEKIIDNNLPENSVLRSYKKEIIDLMNLYAEEVYWLMSNNSTSSYDFNVFLHKQASE